MGISLRTKEDIKKLAEVQSFLRRKMLVKNNPEILLYVAAKWYKDKNFNKLVEIAINQKPEIITRFKGKYGLVVSPENVKAAVMANPMSIGKMDKEMSKMIDKDLFIDALTKEVNILGLKNINDVKVFTKKYVRAFTVNRKGEEVEVKTISNLRRDILKAFNLYTKHSRYHQGYDDEALAICKRLEKAKADVEVCQDVLESYETFVNICIKDDKQVVRSMSPKAWLNNNGRAIYKAVRKSAKEDSELEGLFADIPFDSFLSNEKFVSDCKKYFKRTADLTSRDAKTREEAHKEFDEYKLERIAGMIKRAAIAAIKENPNEYTKLKDYGYEYLVDDNLVKYNAYKSFVKHKMVKEAEALFTDKEQKRYGARVERQDKKEKDKKAAKSASLEN